MVSVTERAQAPVARGGLWIAFKTALHRHESLRGYLLLSPTLLVMLALMIIPLLGLVVLSFCTQIYFDIDYTPTIKNYVAIFDVANNPIYLVLLFRSILMSLTTTFFVVITAYPMAYFLAFRVFRGKLIWLILITVPFWTSYLLRVFAWKIILGFQGVINSGLISLGIIKNPLEFLLYNPTAVVITLTHAWAAFAILPIYVSLEKIDRSLLEAATDLGDTPRERFWRVTFPLSLPGMIAATLLVFIPTVGDYVTPSLVGGTSGIMIGNLIQSLFGKANNAPLGAAVSIVMMLAITLIVCVFLGAVGRRRWKQS
ncbi:MAG TPA: ABC transporter permease [Hypericibacter adhaerens]|jgi:spermidine/putrescine transport system permease protein|uniref:Spermidine/putrescine ABC transporter permease n=1 Tax=Hypericibacter adhaerens TaxID=2602016 RepID=A0A5J6MXZ4_9PROT|nr:ABC transporter permease [Hypericibacter adhaerens]QEX22409.1 spermidine/putrescine ABC transporter permease [Hypericibacter adhaerens]HWA45952.1 ABC transporter permease [Hypericibacter adhaerens]